MRKLARILLWSASAVGVLLAVVLVLLFTVDVNLFRAPLERQVSAALGRTVVFEGPLTLERSLMPRFSVDGLKIGNPAWASRPLLASVDEFGIRVSLLPLLAGELEILSLEFEGVDLFVEVNEEGLNNLIVDQPQTTTGPAPLPAIERISMRDVMLGYRIPDLPQRSVRLERIDGRKVPGEPIELAVQTKLNTVPIGLSLRAERADEQRSDGPWQAVLLGEIGRMSLRIEGNIADTTEWDSGAFRVHVEGPHLDDLETLSGQDLPDTEDYELDARVGFDLDDYFEITEFTASIGDSDLRGSLDWDIDAVRPAFKVRLNSQRLDVDDLGLDELADEGYERTVDEILDLPLDPSLFTAVDLDVGMSIEQLDGLDESVRNVALELYADNEDVRVSARADLPEVRLVADAALPWGKRIDALESDALDLRTLLKYLVLDGTAEPVGTTQLYTATLVEEGAELSVTRVEAAVQPGEPVSLRADAQINDRVIEARLTGPILEQMLHNPVGPWQDLTADVSGARIQLDVQGNVEKPFEASGFDLRYTLEGSEPAELLPWRGRYTLRGRYRDQPGRHLFEDLKLQVGDSDLGGRIVIRYDDERPTIQARLSSSQLVLDQLRAADAGQGGGELDLNQPLEIGDAGSYELDIELQVGRVEGVEVPVRDIQLAARSSGERLSIQPIRATIDDTPLKADLTLPWGRRLTRLGQEGISLQQLSRHADLTVQADLAAEQLQYETRLLGRDFALELTGFEANAGAGSNLQLLAYARLGGKPVQARLQAEPLADLLQRPAGPWRDLRLQLEAGDIRFAAQGQVKQPLEGAGLDISYVLSGAEIDRLLPLFDLILPLEGAYRVSGRFSDQPDRILLEDLTIASGQSDISGTVVVHRGRERPRVEAKFTSDRIYLRELLPVNEAEEAGGPRERVIPDYDLPLETLSAFDGELLFDGKKLSTKFGDIGDIKFAVSLEDGLLRIAPFRVRGWAGGLVTADLSIDAAQDPPLIQTEWVANDLNYGLLLRQAGVAEIVEGSLDFTLRLSGTGRTRYELLADADGQVIIVAEDGRVGSRMLDLWGASLLTTMLSPSWHAADVTKLNCVVFHATIEDGILTSDDLLVDTPRVSIGAVGTLNLETEALNMIFAPRPKRASLLSLTNPARVGGTLAQPEVSITVLPSGRALTSGVLFGLVNPATLVLTLANTGTGEANPCLAAVDTARDLKATPRELQTVQVESPAETFSLFPGCSKARRR